MKFDPFLDGGDPRLPGDLHRQMEGRDARAREEERHERAAILPDQAEFGRSLHADPDPVVRGEDDLPLRLIGSGLAGHLDNHQRGVRLYIHALQVPVREHVVREPALVAIEVPGLDPPNPIGRGGLARLGPGWQEPARQRGDRQDKGLEGADGAFHSVVSLLARDPSRGNRSPRRPGPAILPDPRALGSEGRHTRSVTPLTAPSLVGSPTVVS
jgi:hypothetical protein